MKSPVRRRAQTSFTAAWGFFCVWERVFLLGNRFLDFFQVGLEYTIKYIRIY